MREQIQRSRWEPHSMMKRPRYLVEATTTFGQRNSDSIGWHRDYEYTLPAAETTAQQWYQCQYHDNVRLFRIDIGDEITDMIEFETDSQDQ